MKTSGWLRITAIFMTVVVLLSLLSLVVSANESCFHDSEKKIVEKSDSGFTIANVCKNCDKQISDIGYVTTTNDSTITLYKDSARGTAYTKSELAAGFTNASGAMLYAPKGVLINTGNPYWVAFDLKVKSLPTLENGHAQANLDDTNLRAYKGCSLICTVLGSAYISPLRVIYDGWEADSGATGTTGATADGKAQIKLYAADNAYRDTETVTEVKVGDNIHFDMRLEPSTGAYDVYVDGFYVTSGKMATSSNDTTSSIRFWEGDGKSHGGNLDFTNIEIFYDNYTKAVHTHNYYETIQFDDEGVTKYNACDCGNRTILDCDPISSTVSDGLANIYDGLGEFNINADSYWFVTDMNIRGEIDNGSLLKFGDEVILEAKNGQFISGTSVLGTIVYPTTYQVAAELKNGTYDLYINGRYTISGTVADANNIVCGDIGFEHYVRFLYNKAVTLGKTNTPAIPNYTVDASAKPCYHQDNMTNASDRVLVHTKDGVKYIYNCSLCGERVYSMLKKDLTSPTNDVAYKYKPSALLLGDLKSFSTNTPRYLYLENKVISKTAEPYWLTFDVTPTTIPSNATGNLADPNSRVYKGYGLVSTEPAFIPTTELRVIPDGWEEGNASGTQKGVTDGKCEVKIINETSETHISSDTINYRFTKTVAYLEAGKTTSFALRIDPKTGIYDVYVDGVYMATSKKEPSADMTPKIAFHDNGMGEFVYSNVSVCQEAYNFDDKVTVIELTAKFDAEPYVSSNVYTALLAIEREGEKYNLFYVNNKNGTLEFKNESGKFNTLYDDKGNVVYLDEAQSLAVVYDDINGDLRYYVGGKLARYMDGDTLVWANEVKSYNSEFVNVDGKNNSLRFDPSRVTDVNVIGVGKTDTAEIVGFQSHELNNSIRLLSGLDSLYYGAVGYEVQAYKPDGEKYSDESVIKTSDMIYSSVKADGITLHAAKYGYNYFSALSIEGDFFGYKGSYIIVKPFTKICDKTYYGEEIRMNILDNGKYEFAETK